MKIFCKDFSEINWEQVPSYSIHPSVHLWLINVATDAQIVQQLKDTLNEDELKRTERFAFEKDRNQFITAHGTLRTVLAKYLETTPSAIQFKKSKNKKPQLLFPLTSLKFNISHSENKILIAVSDAETGVDIEMIKPGFEFKEFIKTYFSSGEQNKILNSPNPNETFYKYWTRKESVLKASGLGIIDNLKEIEVCNDENNSSFFKENLYVASFKIEENFFASIACTPDKPIRFLKI
ncbi:MAG TPA: 4'-phosphopantetheinyl transferase superfamily protein [Bacteroidia bacterium]|nr:4'-phosphopantetheinyl transferase superfamily protein [Bacteroidia bacterium]